MKKYGKWILLAFFVVVALVFSFNNDFLYTDTIIEVTATTSVKTDESTNSLGLVEEYYLETITGVITNTSRKGEVITVENEYTTSNIVTEKYQVGDKLFISGGEIKGLKRDSLVVLITIIFMVGIIIIGKSRGILTILSVVVNSFLFGFGIYFYLKGIPLLLVSIILAFLFSAVSLLISNGFNSKTYASIVAVFISLICFISLVIIVSLTTNYQGISFNEIGFLTVPVTDVFLAGLLISGLGAIMDIAITIISASNELISKNSKIKVKTLVSSLKNIGSDVMGSMINVLFFTYFCGSLPIFVLATRNGYSVFNFITANFSTSISRFLVGSIGIVLTIPISIMVAVWLYERGKKHE